MYLKCTHCGYYNQIKTQYLSICGGCNKKLQTTYEKWKTHNSEGSFDEFVKEIGVYPPKDTSSSKPKKRWKIIVSGVFLVFLVLLLYTYEKSLYLWSTSNNTPQEILQKEWSKRTYGKYELTLSTPTILNKINQLPSNMVEYLEDYESFKNKVEEPFQIILTSRKYTPGVIADYNSVAIERHNKIIQLNGVTKFSFTEESISKKGIPGVYQKGGFVKNGREHEFSSAYFGLESHVWEVFISYESTDTIAEKLSQKVISSMNIDYEIPFFSPQ